ncbi:MAG: hypothetical protein ACX931_15700 [Saccharospirillum sp.]
MASLALPIRALYNPGIMTLAWVRGWLAVLTTLALMALLNRETRFGLLRLAWLSLPGALASLVGLGMATLVEPIAPASPLWQLLWLGTAFVIGFTGVMVAAFWWLAGFSEEYRHIRGQALHRVSKRQA